MDYLSQPLTKRQIKGRLDRQGYVTAIIAVDLGELIDTASTAEAGDDGPALGLMAEKVAGDPCALIDMDYRVMGHLKDTLFLEVRGCPAPGTCVGVSMGPTRARLFLGTPAPMSCSSRRTRGDPVGAARRSDPTPDETASGDDRTRHADGTGPAER